MFGRKKAPAKDKQTEGTAAFKKSSKETANINKQKNQIERLPAEPPELQKQKKEPMPKEPEKKEEDKSNRLTSKDVQLRPIRGEEELNLVLSLLESEEFRICASDIRDLLETHGNAMWGAFSPTSGKLMGCCLVAPMDTKSAYVSHLVTSPQHRRKGVASLLFNRAIKSAAERNLLLAVSTDMEAVFERWNYHFSRHICSCDGTPKIPENYTPPSSVKIEPITFENLGDVLEFDQSVCSIDRSHAFRTFLKSGNTLCGLCATVNGKLDGFAFLRKESATSARLSAFYAESYDTARALLYALIKEHVKPGMELVVWFSIVNIDRCRKLYLEFGMDAPETQFRLMYSEEDVNVPWYKVYGIYEHYANLV